MFSFLPDANLNFGGLKINMPPKKSTLHTRRENRRVLKTFKEKNSASHSNSGENSDDFIFMHKKEDEFDRIFGNDVEVNVSKPKPNPATIYNCSDQSNDPSHSLSGQDLTTANLLFDSLEDGDIVENIPPAVSREPSKPKLSSKPSMSKNKFSEDTLLCKPTFKVNSPTTDDHSSTNSNVFSPLVFSPEIPLEQMRKLSILSNSCEPLLKKPILITSTPMIAKSYAGFKNIQIDSSPILSDFSKLTSNPNVKSSSSVETNQDFVFRSPQIEIHSENEKVTHKSRVLKPEVEAEEFSKKGSLSSEDADKIRKRTKKLVTARVNTVKDVFASSESDMSPLSTDGGMEITGSKGKSKKLVKINTTKDIFAPSECDVATLAGGTKEQAIKGKVKKVVTIKDIFASESDVSKNEDQDTEKCETAVIMPHSPENATSLLQSEQDSNVDPMWKKPDKVLIKNEKSLKFFCPDEDVISRKKSEAKCERDLRGGTGWRRRTQFIPASRKTMGYLPTRDDDKFDISMATLVRQRRTTILFRPNLSLHRSVILNESIVTPRLSDKTQAGSISLALNEDRISTVDKILERCTKNEIIKFENLFNENVLLDSKKIGEGSYGEVFLMPSKNQENGGDDSSNPVLKVVPVDGDELINGDVQTRLDDMLAEIVVSTELSQLSKLGHARNFVEILDCYLTEGYYPNQLLKLWDDFDATKGSENDRPDQNLLKSNQRFIGIVFSNGGKDLEDKELTNASKAISIFWQVAHALAVAEELLEFEHRDLHWGNILISETREKSVKYTIKNEDFSVPTNGNFATIIDFTLSRMTSIKDSCEIFNDLGKDPQIFTAHGDYQFDIYRMMREEVQDNWESFHPKTNIFWLHYLLDKLINEISYKAKKSQVHRKNMALLRKLKENVLNYDSCIHLVMEHYR